MTTLIHPDHTYSRRDFVMSVPVPVATRHRGMSSKVGYSEIWEAAKVASIIVRAHRAATGEEIRVAVVERRNGIPAVVLSGLGG